jgi:hypothetical protein
MSSSAARACPLHMGDWNVMNGGFVDPTPGLRAEYEAALQQLRSEFAGRQGFLDRWRFRKRVWELQRRYLDRVTAKW